MSPIKTCTEDGKPGYKWGDSGKCYTYTPGNEASRKAAKKKAIKQGVAAGYQTGNFDLSEEMKLMAEVDLPSKCYCWECDYVVTNPGKHCKDLKCPKCGVALHRIKEKPNGGKKLAETKKLADYPDGYQQPWAVCKLCGYAVYGNIDGKEPQLAQCPVCGSFMEDPSGYLIKKTTEDALKLHYAPWK